MPNIATNTTVDLAGLLDFVRVRHRALLLTTRVDGRPQASPLTCGVDSAGRLVISTYPERQDPERPARPAGQRDRVVRRVERSVGAD